MPAPEKVYAPWSWRFFRAYLSSPTSSPYQTAVVLLLQHSASLAPQGGMEERVPYEAIEHRRLSIFIGNIHVKQSERNRSTLYSFGTPTGSVLPIFVSLIAQKDAREIKEGKKKVVADIDLPTALANIIPFFCCPSSPSSTTKP